MSITWRSQKSRNSKRNETVLADWVSAGDMLPDYIGLPVSEPVSIEEWEEDAMDLDIEAKEEVESQLQRRPA
jgi:hypothetical protein